MLKNITLSAEDRLLAKARLRAQQEKTNLNAIFRGWLERYTAKDGAGERYDRLMKRLSHVSAGRKFTREEMNER
ncbi:MAG TPA: hypothetical protein VIK53_12565 [Verrucomicrobiae bacterium]